MTEKLPFEEGKVLRKDMSRTLATECRPVYPTLSFRLVGLDHFARGVPMRSDRRDDHGYSGEAGTGGVTAPTLN